MAEPKDTMPRLVSIADLRNCAADVLRRLGHPDDHATMIADIVIDSELRGYDDHGVSMLAWISLVVHSGHQNPRPSIATISETESALLLDGDGGSGVIPGMRAMHWCIEQAQAQRGIACASVRHAGAVITSAPYVELAARAGLIGFTCVNASPLMTAPGGMTRLVGTNPLAYGVPAGRHYPIIFDMAASTVAAQKMRIAALEGRMVPEGLVADARGRTTTDPREFWPPTGANTEATLAGSILPLGWPHASHKGFGLSMMADVLAGVLSGGAFAQTANVVTSDVGQFYWALDVRAFMPLEEFRSRVDAQIDQVKASERAEGVEEVFVPGERGQRRRESLLARGTVPLSEGSWDQLAKACEAAGVTLPPNGR